MRMTRLLRLAMRVSRTGGQVPTDDLHVVRSALVPQIRERAFESGRHEGQRAEWPATSTIHARVLAVADEQPAGQQRREGTLVRATRSALKKELLHQDSREKRRTCVAYLPFEEVGRRAVTRRPSPSALLALPSSAFHPARLRERVFGAERGEGA